MATKVRASIEHTLRRDTLRRAEGPGSRRREYAVAVFAVAVVAALAAGAAFGACVPRADTPARSRLYPGEPRLPAWASASTPAREALDVPSQQWADADNRGASDPWLLGWRGRRGMAGSYSPPPRVVDTPPLTPAELTESLQAGPPYVELGGSNELIFEHGWIRHDVPAPELERLPGIVPLTAFEEALVRHFAGDRVSVFCDQHGPVAYWIPHRLGGQFGGHVVGRDGEIYWMMPPRPAYRVEPGSYLAFVPLPIPLGALSRPARWGWRGARGAVLVAVHLGRIAMSTAPRIVGRTHHLVRVARVAHAAARAELEHQLRTLAVRGLRAAGKATRVIDESLSFRGQARAAGRAGRGGSGASGAGSRGSPAAGQASAGRGSAGTSSAARGVGAQQAGSALTRGGARVLGID